MKKPAGRKRFGNGGPHPPGSQCWRGKTRKKKSANHHSKRAEIRDDTGSNLETHQDSRKIEGLPGAGQLQVASK
jgi:hypothetical protein